MYILVVQFAIGKVKPSDVCGGKNSHSFTSIPPNKTIVPFHVKIFHCCFLELSIFGLKFTQSLFRL